MAAPPETSWHLDKKVNISVIIAILMLAISIFVWGSKIEQRVAIVESATARQDQEFRRYVVEMREDVRELSRKIDKLIESRGRQP